VGREGVELIGSRARDLGAAKAELDRLEASRPCVLEALDTGVDEMRIAAPVAGRQLRQHFGGVDSFALVAADEDARRVTGREDDCPPAHERRALSAWLRTQGVSTVLAGGIGVGAALKLAAGGVEVVVGGPGANRHERGA